MCTNLLYGAGMTSDDVRPPRISARQRQIMMVIGESIRRRGYPPTVREIGAAVGLGSPSSVAHHLKVLERHGLLRRDAKGPRAVDIRGSATDVGGHPLVDIPVLGAIAAGT